VELVQEFTPVGSRSLLAASFDDGGGMDDDFQNIFYYDNIQRLVQIDQSGVQGGNTVAEKRVNFAYNAAGQLTSIARYKDLDGGSGNLVATTSFVYDGIARLTDLTHTHDTTTIADYDWDYDAFSRVTSMSFTALVGDDGSSAYTYDDTNQLTGADHDFQTDETYEYDENGNRTMSGYATGDNNLTTSDGTYDYEYDDEGNRTKKTHISLGDYVTYEWDHRNRLVGVEFRTSGDVLTKRVEYEYDLFNRRISKRVDDDGDTNSDWAQRFVYDGDSIVLVFDDTGSLTNRYLHGPAVDQILADEDSLGEVAARRQPRHHPRPGRFRRRRSQPPHLQRLRRNHLPNRSFPRTPVHVHRPRMGPRRRTLLLPRPLVRPRPRPIHQPGSDRLRRPRPKPAAICVECANHSCRSIRIGEE
jgi:YD repeat-containing protein